MKTLENIEDGTKCNIADDLNGGYNVIFIDADSNQMIQGTMGFKKYEDAIAKANYYLNK